MKNKLYQVQGVHSDYCNVVSAPNARQAKLIGANKEWTEGVDFVDLRVSAIKGGSSWWQGEPEIHFEVIGKGFVYTDIKSGLVDWNEFIEEVSKQKSIIIDTTMTFDEYQGFYGDDYFGVPKEEYNKIIDSPDLEHAITCFDEFCELYGVDVSKITFRQAEQLLEGELTLPQLKEQQK